LGIARTFLVVGDLLARFSFRLTTNFTRFVSHSPSLAYFLMLPLVNH